MAKWYPGKRFLSHTLPYLEAKIGRYAAKFPMFDERILIGCGLCYKYSPLFRAHVGSPHFGETLGWRVTYLWTEKADAFPELALIGPLDLGLYSVRIDSILGRTRLERFVKIAKRLPIFKTYIEATEHFLIQLLAAGEDRWLHHNHSSTAGAVEVCKQYSPTFKEVLASQGDGWGIVKTWVPDPESIASLRRIYPLDVGMYCVRLDSIINGTDLKGFQDAVNTSPAFKMLPMEVLRFVADVRRQCG